MIRIEIPEKGTFISFIHHNRSIKVPFVVYADFEAFTEEISTCKPDQEFSFTKKYQKHRPSEFCFKIVCFDKRFKSKLVVYRAKDDNEDIGQKLVEMLEEEIKRIQKEFDFSAKMIPLTKEEQCEFENANFCWICQKEFGESKKVRDHCISQENIVEPPTTNVIFNSKNQNSLPGFSIIFQDMIPTCL